MKGTGHGTFVLFCFYDFFNGKTEGRQWTLNNSDKRNDPLRVNNLQLVVLIGSKELYKITTVNVVLSSVHGEKVMVGGLPSRLPKPVLLPVVSRRGWSFENTSYFSKSLTAQIRKFILAFKNKEKWTHMQAHIHEASCRLQLDGGEKTDHCPILFSMNKRGSTPSHHLPVYFKNKTKTCYGFIDMRHWLRILFFHMHRMICNQYLSNQYMYFLYVKHFHWTYCD